MEILRIETVKEKKEAILTNVISTIETAYSATREAQPNDDLLIGIFKIVTFVVETMLIF